MTLRPYQQAAVDAAVDWMRKSLAAACIEAATGAGKSHIIAEIARQIHQMTGKRAEISVSGSGDIEIGGGTVGAGEYSVTGSGNIDADGLVAQTLDVSITGSGDVGAQATGKADINILGSGNVTLGGGANCSSRQMGSGSVTCK